MLCELMVKCCTGAVGSLPGDKLPQMLISTLNRSGRAFNDLETQTLETAVTAAQSAIDEKNPFRAAIALATINKLGSPDELGSFADGAMKAAGGLRVR